MIGKMTDFAKLMKEIRRQTQGRPEYEVIKGELQRTAGASERVAASDDEEVVQTPGKFDRFKGRRRKRQAKSPVTSSSSSEKSHALELGMRQSVLNKRLTQTIPKVRLSNLIQICSVDQDASPNKTFYF